MNVLCEAVKYAIEKIIYGALIVHLLICYYDHDTSMM